MTDPNKSKTHEAQTSLYGLRQAEVTGNQKIVSLLRGLADSIERSPIERYFKATASGSEPVSVSVQSLDERLPAISYGPANLAIFIGDPLFVGAAPDVWDVMPQPLAKKSKGKK